jgi:glycine betaine/choline ABC-type transport system substrate-binding protein
MTLNWPEVVLIMFLVFVVLVAASEPRRRRHELEMAEVKAKGPQEYQVLAEKFAALAQETRDLQASMRTDLGAVRVSVEAIETMMREVG